MERERWQRVERLYHLALEHETSERAAFIAQACGGDKSLQQEVETLLAESEGIDSFLEAPALDAAARDLAASAEPEIRLYPAAIGGYRIIRLLGEGGMGTVYEAEQEQPRRLVALKVIKLGLATPDRLRRFRRESQALARLQHPGIAQIYESNTADTGFGPQPYFAMEFIRGLSLREYAEVHQLTNRERLLLMIKVCEAVHHAHQRGLIHRDLKPGNILVDETGQPKILDFGVARITQADVEEGEVQPSMQTDIGLLLGTLAYMSPEQVAGDPLEVDTRSDVYSLGVILYEILSGRLPYEVKHRQLTEAVQTIREEDPASLSSIDRSYRGDVETIVKRALEKDKTRRYASAADLGADIQRYLNDEPITARPPSASYQLRKLARRHRGLMAGLAAIFVVLLLAAGISIRLSIRANREAAVAQAVNDFLQNDLLAQASANTQAGPNVKPDPDLKVRTALDRAAARIGGKFDRQPEVEAGIRQTIGDAYVDLGIYPEAEKHLERALDLRRRQLGEDHSDTLSVMNDLVYLYRDEGKYPQAEPLASELLEIRRRLLGAHHPDTLDAMNTLGLLYHFEGKPAQAEPLLSEVLETRRRISGEDNTATLYGMSNLGVVYEDEGKYGQAENLLSRALEIRRRVQGQEHPDTLLVAFLLARVYNEQRKYAQAEALQNQVLEIRLRVLGPEHSDTISSMYFLGVVYRNEGKLSQAEPLLSKVLETQSRVLGEEHPFTLFTMISLATLYRYQGEYSKAEPLMVTAVNRETRVLAEEHPERLAGMTRLAALYSDEGKYLEAEALFTRALKVQLGVLGELHPYTLDSRGGLGQLQLRERNYVEAEATLREALKGYEKVMPESWERYDYQSMLGGSLAGQKKYTEAEALLVSGYEGMMQRVAAIPLQQRLLSEARDRITQLYESWGKPEKSAEWRQKLPAK